MLGRYGGGPGEDQIARPSGVAVSGGRLYVAENGIRSETPLEPALVIFGIVSDLTSPTFLGKYV